MQVAGNKILVKINKALGELDVKRQAIANKVKDVQSQMDKVNQGLYSTEARLEVLGRKKTKSEEAVAEIESKLVEVTNWSPKSTSLRKNRLYETK